MMGLDQPARYEGVTLTTRTDRQHWIETDLNWHMREALMAQGFRAVHIREANETGIADLVVYHSVGREDVKTPPLPVLDAWVELKMDPSIKPSNIRSSQRQFMRDHWEQGRNAIFVMYDRKTDLLVVRQGNLKGRLKMLEADPYRVNWQEVFDHFRRRSS